MVSMTNPRQWYEAVEQYTPNGIFGRLLLAVPLGPIGVYTILVSVGVVTSFGLLWLPVALVLAGAGLAATLLTVAMLWPVYLSLIGRLDSTKDYAQTATTSQSEESKEDPIDVLKYREHFPRGVRIPGRSPPRYRYGEVFTTAGD